MTEFSAAAPAASSQPSQLVSLHRRFGKPQVYALILLAAFAAQCFWLAARTRLSNSEMRYVGPAHVMTALDPVTEPRSPVVTLLSRVMLAGAFPSDVDAPFWRMWLRAPFIIVGGLLGASLWYVSRRLYGNVGGYIALTLYAFSPSLIQRWAAIEPDVLAAWGAFGCVFTGIAVAHTLYAPREVVLWNWRRIVLLGTAIGVGAAAVPAMVFAVPIALVFMLYLVPHRRGAAVGILAAACGVGAVILLLMFGFRWAELAAFVRQSGGLYIAPGAMTRGVVGVLAGSFVFRNGPAFTTLLAVCVAVWIRWGKARFFGTAAPLIVALAFVALALLTAHRDVLVFLLMALPFLFTFVAGVCADLFEIESPHAPVIRALVLATVASHALFSISGLVRLWLAGR